MINNWASILINYQPATADDVFMLSPYKPGQTHEGAYLSVREKENRVLNDEAVKQLPSLSKNFPHYHEWQLRKQTANKFFTFLAGIERPLQLLDLGCGNGWFAAKLATIPQVKVIGLDLNLPELQQAQRLFASNNLLFCYGNIFAGLFQPESFDLIVLNASIQYFPSLDLLFATLFWVLKPTGEIHILDSPFYENVDVLLAKQRTVDYYSSLDHSEMAHHYFHHTFQNLEPYAPIIKNRKHSFWKKLVSMDNNPFPWITIKKRQP